MSCETFRYRRRAASWARSAAAVALVVLVAPAASLAQGDGSEQIDDILDLVPRARLSVEVNLTGPVLRLVSATLGAEEPELAGQVDDLDSVRVRVAPLDGVDEDLVARFDQAGDRLVTAGWMTMVRLRDNGESTWILVRPLPEAAGDGLADLALLSSSDDEVTVIHLAGSIDPESLGALAEGLDIPSLALAEEIVEEQP